ncbi:LysR family transcriptional regulator [Zhengella mangrovi]|uniref:LysR family transcriptional regulator n=1 Tax=Zhengella mangrovi TaxID=1982044 RepID=A0A2G1QJU8_9HYPH|nr:LysR family transcriptional regulator [Zhengella mangrovi]PHP65805.1 LysR family transcriptional regulator [Zhengella mangrovi]
MDRLSVMKAFCRVVERGSFARAAEDLGISPALLSRDIKLLEQALSVQLLSRTTRRMAVTDHGRLYYEDCRRILQEIDEVEARARRGAGRVAGSLRVNAPSSFGLTVLSAMLPGFMDAYPDVQLTLHLDDHVIDMIEGGYDLSIRIRAGLPDSVLVARRIGTVRQALFASPDYVTSHGAPRSPTQLQGHDILGYLLADQPQDFSMTGPAGEETVPVTPRAFLGSSLLLRDLLANGRGIGALPDFLSAPLECDRRLVRILPGWSLPERQIYAVTPSHLGMDGRVSAFVTYLQQYLPAPEETGSGS